MRQLTFVRPGFAEWREAPEPRLERPLEALVRPIVIGRCDLDVAYLTGLAPQREGVPIGHEMIGEVVDIGDGVLRLHPGDVVVVPAQINCGLCGACRRGWTGRCEAVPFAASYGMGRAGDYGCLAADLVRVPFADAMLVALPEGLDPVRVIGAADVATDSWRTVAGPLAARPGARVLVRGGPIAAIGIYAAGMAVVMGAGEVVYVDEDPARRAAAAAYGARALATLEPDERFEIVVDASLSEAAALEALRAAAPEAIITCVAPHFGKPTSAFPLAELYHKGATFVTGRPNCRANLEPTLSVCRHTAFDPELIGAKVFPFDDTPEAWVDPAVRVVAVVEKSRASAPGSQGSFRPRTAP